MKVSPSQINTKRECLRKFAWAWTHGFWPPSSPKQEFGSQVHGALENWLSKGQFDDYYTDRKGKKFPIRQDAIEVAKQGICQPFFPLPDDYVEVEKEMDIALPDARLFGYIDVVVPPMYECRAYLPQTRALPYPIVTDHKTTTDFKWMKTPEDLMTDPQALAYSAWAMLYFETRYVLARWIYYKSNNPKSGERKPKGVKFVECWFDAASPQFKNEIAILEQDIADIVYIRKNKIPAMDLPPSPHSCANYGGCFHMARCQLDGADLLKSLIK